jgi:hypothetical protein
MRRSNSSTQNLNQHDTPVNDRHDRGRNQEPEDNNMMPPVQNFQMFMQQVTAAGAAPLLETQLAALMAGQTGVNILPQFQQVQYGGGNSFNRSKSGSYLNQQDEGGRDGGRYQSHSSRRSENYDRANNANARGGAAARGGGHSSWQPPVSRDPAYNNNNNNRNYNQGGQQQQYNQRNDQYYRSRNPNERRRSRSRSRSPVDSSKRRKF